MKTDRFQKYLDKQKKEIDDYKWNLGIKLNKDPGEDAIKEWISKYAKRFRKEFALSDLKDALLELKLLQDELNNYLKEIQKLTEIISNCQEKMIEGIELIESESNGN